MIKYQPVLSPPIPAAVGVVDIMAEDCLASFDDTGRVEEDALRRAGWSQHAINENKEAATAAFVRLLNARNRARA